MITPVNDDSTPTEPIEINSVLEQKLQRLLTEAPAGIALLEGPEHLYSFVNPLYQKMFGRTAQQLLGKSLQEAFPESDGQWIYDEISQVYHSGQASTIQNFPATFQEGDSLRSGFYDFTIQPVRNERGEVSDLLLYVHDVTNKVEAHKKIAESESKYHSLVNGMDQGFCVIQLLFDEKNQPVDYLFLEVNPVFEWQTGLKNPAGKTARQLVPGLEDHWFQRYGQVALTGTAVRFTEGSEAMGRWFEVNAFRLGGEDSRKVALLFTDITKRKEIERDLLNSENYFHQLTDTVPAIIWITRPDGYCTYLNKNWYEFTGQSKGEAEGFGWLKATHPDDAEEAGRAFIEATKNQQPYYMLYRIRHKSGDYRWAIDSGQPKFDGDGSFEGMIGTVIDVHEQKLAEDKIRESEKRFHAMADASPVMIWTLDEKGHSTYYNSRAREFTGDGEEDLVKGKTWQLAIHPDDIAYAAGVVSQAVADRTPYEMECRMRRYDGEWRWLLNQGIPRFGNKGEFFGFVGSSVDITDHKNSQQALEAALDQLRLSKEAAELGTFDMDLTRGTLHWDERCRILFGISHQSPVTYESDFVGGLHPDDRERITKVIDNLMIRSISDGNYDVEYRTVGQQDGRVRWVRAKGKVYFDIEDRPLRFVGSVIDITEQVSFIQKMERTVEERTKELAQANHSLQLINKELHRSNQNLEEFAHAASHDLKEPIRKISFFAHQLEDQLTDQLTEKQKFSFGRIANASERMMNLIDDLLLYSHVSQRPQETENVNLNKKVQQVLEDLELDINERKAVVQVKSLPLVHGYPRQLQQLFQNLISNALKYSKAGVSPLIEIMAEEVWEDDVRFHLISIKDNGIGFEQQYTEKIFQMFTRLHGRSEYSGTGVGLSIVKKVVENHNGFIRVKSEVEKGTVFNIYLPA